MVDQSMVAQPKHPGPPVPVPYEEGEGPKRRMGRNKEACGQPRGNSAVNAVYPDAMEIAGFTSAAGVKGMGVFAGLFGLVGAAFGWQFGFMILTDARGYALAAAFFTLFGLVALGVAITFFRLDLFTYRDEPILFNRKTRKVHLFRRRTRMTKPWQPWPLVIDTYDWDCITGEIHGGLQLVGGSLPALRYRLLAAVSDAPTGPGRKTKVIDRFLLGMEESYQDDCVARWEHIRRYMEEDGPPLQGGERLALTRGFSHRLALARGGLWVLLPDFYKDFAKHPTSLSLGTLVQVLLSPLLIFFAVFRWLAEISSRAPWWPQEILEAAGGKPLPEAQVHTQADELAKAMEQVEEAALTDEERKDRAYVKAKAEEPFWTPERRKYGFLLLSLGVLFGIGKAVQFWIRGY
jgi:hypothetical protein